MKTIKSPANLYLYIISLLGFITFFLNNTFQLDTSPEKVTLFAFIGAVLLLNHYTIPIPPKGNSTSMDSAIYMASIFLYGLNFTLDILIFVSIIYGLYERKVAIRKHFFNFSLYCLMMISSSQIFGLSGGVIGEIHIMNLASYGLSLTTYFVVNMILIGVYFYLLGRENIRNVFTGMLRDKSFLVSYLTTLLLSIVFGILIYRETLFGLFLFVGIAMLLSVAFNQHFKLYQETLDKANKDFLTGLNNHGYFKELLEKEVAMAKESDKPLMVGLLDLDDFKKYNDIYGHIAGDQLLQEFGLLLMTESEKQNYVVARYGGEEFSIMMPNTDRQIALSFMNDLRKKANDTYFKGVESLPYGCLSFSAGIAECKKETYSISELLNQADQAMYAAKNQGKNMVQIFNEYSEYVVPHSLCLEKDLEEAEQQLKIFLSKDVYTYRHSKRVYQYAVDFSKMLNLSDHERKTLILGALIHDIGKIEIPRDILNKKGKLDPHEWEIMKKHVTWGKEIISTNKRLDDLIPLVELHHERFDGNGYPYGLKGKSIPKLARILCIIDSFDAMTTERPYQRTKSFKEAIVELRACSGKQFDPQFVEPFITMIKQQDENLLIEERLEVAAAK